MGLNDGDHLFCVTTIVAGVLFVLMIIRDVMGAKYRGELFEHL